MLRWLVSQTMLRWILEFEGIGPGEGIFYWTDGFVPLKALTGLFRGDRCKTGGQAQTLFHTGEL